MKVTEKQSFTCEDFINNYVVEIIEKFEMWVNKLTDESLILRDVDEFFELFPFNSCSLKAELNIYANLNNEAVNIKKFKSDTVLKIVNYFYIKSVIPGIKKFLEIKNTRNLQGKFNNLNDFSDIVTFIQLQLKLHYNFIVFFFYSRLKIMS